jgi:dihydrofolate reductase
MAGADTRGDFMVRVIYYVASSIDGLIAPADGSRDWLSPFSDNGEDYGYADFYATVDALVVGARTYEQMLDFGEWPHHDRPVTVMSSRPIAAAVGGITISPLDPRAVVDELAAAGHRRIWLVGGGVLASSFAAAGLIDEYIVSYLPVLLGSGIGLLGGHGDVQALQLVASERFGDGVVQGHYRTHA